MTGEAKEYTVRDAAAVLGTTEGAVRARIRRGTLRYVKRGRRLYVLMYGTEQSGTEYSTHERDALTSETSAALIAELQDRVRSLEEANRENRRLLAAALERIPAIEPPGPPETPSEPQSGTGGPQPSERRWWRFWG